MGLADTKRRYRKLITDALGKAVEPSGLKLFEKIPLRPFRQGGAPAGSPRALRALAQRKAPESTATRAAHAGAAADRRGFRSARSSLRALPDAESAFDIGGRGVPARDRCSLCGV